jgi:hypothetical protein
VVPFDTIAEEESLPLLMLREIKSSLPHIFSGLLKRMDLDAFDRLIKVLAFERLTRRHVLFPIRILLLFLLRYLYPITYP